AGRRAHCQDGLPGRERGPEHAGPASFVARAGRATVRRSRTASRAPRPVPRPTPSPTRREVTVSIGDRNVFPRRGPEQIRNRQFVWVRKGYDPEQVQDFLNQLADHVDAIETELRSAREEMERASRRQSSAREEAYQELAKRMADMLAMADAQA